MESLNKTKLLRQALAILGPSTSQELGVYTGIKAHHVSALLSRDLNKGTLQSGWKGKERCYGQPGSMKRVASKIIRASKLNVPVPRDTPSGDYYIFADQARHFEQHNCFDDAAQEWLKAAAVARHYVNQRWCKARAKYCERGWKYPEGDL
ncbi:MULTISPECIES: ANR family transcriptional regulator [unclassified Serratia (in: enterobacteria)]|uniref:ANR family transcriptional regulator n=1 Tax=unclassified Serratia (in: enterobacteria) TaxID=2647522 RepID=UPI000469285F|nr:MULTISPECIES: ANR family transcriptional regulator [unclassified Serratia (in: enterobacteria)]